MKIVNPLYDKAFKYLMQNERYARKVISTILDEEIEELTLSQQETIVPDEKRQLTLFRLDFKALVRKADGTRQKVLIELQKTKYITDIQRFRSYLGSNYMKPEVETIGNQEVKSIYPIITIYILGHQLDELPYLAVSVNRKVVNMADKSEIHVQSDFIEQLNHRSYIIQVRRLPEKRQTLLEKFLVLFNQAWCTDYKYIIDLQDIPEEFGDMARYLQQPLADEDFRRQLEAEDEIDTIFDTQENRYLKQIEEARQREEEARQREEEARQREEEALQKQAEAQKKLARRMKEYGEPPEEIMRETGLSAEEIAAL